VIRKSVIRPAAQAEIDQQADYLAEYAGDAIALRFLDAVQSTITSLLELPDAGSPWLSDDPRLQDIRKRSVSGFPNHLLFYRCTASAIEFLHLYHAKQDIAGRLTDDGMS